MFCRKYWERKSPSKIKSWTRSRACLGRVAGDGAGGGGGAGWLWGGRGEALPTSASSEWGDRLI